MGEIHVQFESLAAGQEGIARAYASLTSTLDQLGSDLAPMVESWSGSAQESYLVRKKEWEDAAASLAQILNAIAQAVGTAHENYTAAEKAAQNTWS